MNFSRLAAMIHGDTTYIDYDPCVQGHVGDHYTRTGACTQCPKEKRRALLTAKTLAGRQESMRNRTIRKLEKELRRLKNVK